VEVVVPEHDVGLGDLVASNTLSERGTPTLEATLVYLRAHRLSCLEQAYSRHYIEDSEPVMRFREIEIGGSWVIDPEPHADGRGRFMRAWCRREFIDQGIDFVPVQANMSLSIRKGTLRGMHYQTGPALEAKLVRCTKGSVFDVVLDLRQVSRTYGKWYGVELTDQNGRMLYVPRGCAHGYQTLVDDTETYYMASEFYTPSAACGVRFNDPTFGIQWPLEATVVSEQDRNWPLIE